MNRQSWGAGQRDWYTYVDCAGNEYTSHVLGCDVPTPKHYYLTTPFHAYKSYFAFMITPSWKHKPYKQELTCTLKLNLSA